MYCDFEDFTTVSKCLIGILEGAQLIVLHI